MTIMMRGEGCIGIQGAPVDVRELLAPCTTGTIRPACIRPSGSPGPGGRHDLRSPGM